MIRDRQANLKAKTRAHANFGFHPNLSIHQIDQLFRNRKSQTSALKLSVSFIIHLIKLTENMVHFVFWDANTRILDRNVDVSLPIELFEPNNAHHHMTTKGEFQCVSNDIGNHLTNTPRITDKIAGHEHVIIDQ